MKKRLPYIITFVVGLLIGAAISYLASLKTLSQALGIINLYNRASLENMAYQVYKKGDFDSSVVALSELVKELEPYYETIKTIKRESVINNKRNIAIDLGLTYARLFVVYERAGKQDLANQYYQKAAELLNSRGEKMVKSPEQLKEFINKIDKGI